jgi:hypothetical protein
MITIASRMMYSESNEFNLKEIYVSDGSSTFILRKDEGYAPVPYPFDLMSMYYSCKGQLFSSVGFSSVRQYQDNDAKSMASYLYDKIRSVNMSMPNAEKTLFDVLSNFGGELNA